MLRLLVLVLLLGNVGFFAWSQGFLAAYGWAPVQQSEPQRLQRQLQPETIELEQERLANVPTALAPNNSAAAIADFAAPSAPAASAVPTVPTVLASGAAAAEAASAPASGLALPSQAASAVLLGSATFAGAGTCLQSAFYTDAQASALRSRLEAAATASTAATAASAGSARATNLPLPTSAWLFEPAIEPARWIVYMGRYTSQEELDKKRVQLRQIGISNFEPLLNPALQPGFSLGHFGNQAQAESALVQATGRGVRTARVVLERPEQRGQRLRLPKADSAMRQAVEALKQPLDRRALLACG